MRTTDSVIGTICIHKGVVRHNIRADELLQNLCRTRDFLHQRFRF